MTVFELTGKAAEAAEQLLAGLSKEARDLVEGSFEPVSFAFGEVIVRAGDAAEALYLVAEGRVRVVVGGIHSDEVELAALGPGDWFGEAALLAETPQDATVRASSPVVVWRLERPLFLSVGRSDPEFRQWFEALARERAISSFLRVQSGFAQLPDEELELLAAGLEPVSASAGEVIVAAGDPPGPLYLVESGHLRAYKVEDGEEEDFEFLRAGDFFGELALAQSVPQPASVAAFGEAKLLRLGEGRFRELLERPGFRKRIEERIAQHDFLHAARVPLDFAQEILPAAVQAHDKISGEQAEPLRDADSELAAAGTLEDGSAAQPRRHRRRFPHVYQLDEADCGAACLAMICRFFGKAVPISRIRDLVHTSTDGTSLGGIARGADQLGLAARAVRASKSKLDSLPLPAIVHWEGNHWVVLYDVDGERVRIADPAIGLERLGREEFLGKWSGFAALIARTDRFDETPVKRTGLEWLKGFFSPHRRAIGATVVLALLAAGLQLLLPILTQVVVDDVLPHHDLNLLWIVMGGLGAVLVAITVATIVQRYLLARVSVRIDTDSLDFLTARLLDLPTKYFATRRTGDIARRLSGLRAVREFVIGSGILALTSATQLLAALGLMFFYNWVLGLVFLATVPLYAVLLRFSSQRLRPMYESLEEAFGEYSSRQIDAIKGIETVKALAAERSFRLMMLEQFQALSQRLFKTQFLVMAYQGGVQLLAFASFALFLGVGSLEVVHGHLTIGEFVSFNALVALANGPVVMLLSLWDELQMTKILVARLDDVLDQEPEQGTDRSRLRPVTTLDGAIELADVGFQYGGTESPPILAEISFRVEPGQTIAIVGRSGSGKTTLVKLLSGLLEPTNGAIRYDGLELRTLDYRTLRRQIGFVLQESFLFDDTIARNIAFGEETPDPDRVAWAARAAAAHDFIQRLPLGYDTRVGESGLAISGGQKQRIAIARALYHRPPVLVFDEATSALDTESERAVKESMDELLAGRTSFVIAHRLSTIRDADRILVLERGRIVEDGTHEQLMAHKGLYYYLASQQLGI